MLVMRLGCQNLIIIIIIIIICMFIQGKIPYQYSKVLLSTRALLK